MKVKRVHKNMNKRKDKWWKDWKKKKEEKMRYLESIK